MSRTKFAAVLIVAALACSPVKGQEKGTQEIPLCNNILPSYLQYLEHNCILPTNGITDTCKQLTRIICGDLAGSILSGAPNPCTAVPGSYVYPLDNYLNTGAYSPTGRGCQTDRSCTHSLRCPVAAVNASTVRCEVYDPTIRKTVGPIDPNSLVAWAKYIQTCYGSNYNPSTTPPSTCSLLSGDLCSRPDVKCDGDNTSFLSKDPGSELVMLLSDPGSCTVTSAFYFFLPDPSVIGSG